jgi:predicted Zn-dependent protease
MFYHPELKFKYPVPPAWQLVNSPMQVQMAPEDGKAMMVFTMAQQKTLNEAVQKTLEDLQLTVLSSKQALVNGLPAVGTVSQQVSQNQQTGEQQVIKVMSYFIEYNGMIYVFHGVSSDADFNSYFRIFESTMVNFDRLTEPSKLNVQPNRLRIKQVRRSGTLNNVFSYYNVPDNQRQELAFLNNLELTDQVAEGKYIKIIGD